MQLDEVVGPDRLSMFNDEKYPPDIAAIVKEILRWRPVSAVVFITQSSKMTHTCTDACVHGEKAQRAYG